MVCKKFAKQDTTVHLLASADLHQKDGVHVCHDEHVTYCNLSHFIIVSQLQFNFILFI